LPQNRGQQNYLHASESDNGNNHKWTGFEIGVS
jgi:hypothetical protein